VSDTRVVTRPITTTVVAPGRVATTVVSSPVAAANVIGGVGERGPAGPQGVPGQTITLLDQLADVAAASPANDDVLRYEGGVWTSKPLTVNGGNF
jgi:hypothetical protein